MSLLLQRWWHPCVMISQSHQPSEPLSLKGRAHQPHLVLKFCFISLTSKAPKPHIQVLWHMVIIQQLPSDLAISTDLNKKLYACCKENQKKKNQHSPSPQTLTPKIRAELHSPKVLTSRTMNAKNKRWENNWGSEHAKAVGAKWA